MADLTLTTADAVVKELYTQQAVENLVYEGAPFLAMIPKKTDFFGDVMPIPLQYGNPQGVSKTFATAQSNAIGSSYARFQLTRSTTYGVATIDGEAIEATKSNKGAFVDLFEREITSMLNQLGRDWHTLAYGNGGGAYGQVASLSTTTLTLANPEDVVNFEVGMELIASTDDGTGSGTDRSGSATITGINRDAGTLTSDSNWASQITSLAANDYLFREGSQGGVFTGLLGWIPTSAPSSTAFFGLNRTSDVTRLGGVRYDGSALSIEEAIQTGASRLARQGRMAKPTHLFLHPDRYNDLCVSLGSKVQYSSHKVGEIGFEGLKLACGPAGWVQVYPDFACPDTQGFLLKMDTWGWYGLDNNPKIIQQDGLRVLRGASSDNVEVRARVRGNFACNAPGFNCNITLPV